MLLVHITDLHMAPPGVLTEAGLEPAPMVAILIDRLNALPRRPDAVMITGDLTVDGRPEEFAALGEALAALEAPFYLLPGNHDNHAGIRSTFPDHGYLGDDGPMNWIVEAGDVRLIGLDSVVPGEVEGRLPLETLEWLRGALTADRRPTVIGVHHPPFAVGAPALDAIGLVNGAELEAVVAEAPHVMRVLCGHLHRPIQKIFGGAIGMIGGPGARMPAFDLFGEKSAVPPRADASIGLHLWSEEAGFVSHVLGVDAD